MSAYLTPENLADRYQIPLATVYKWNSEGTGPARIKLGRHTRYTVDAVLAWEQSKTLGA